MRHNHLPDPRPTPVPFVCVCVCFVFLGPHPWQQRFPGQGSNWSYSCQPPPQPQQRQIRAASLMCTTAHSNARFLTHWARPGIEPPTLWFPVGFISTAPWWELLLFIFEWVVCQDFRVWAAGGHSINIIENTDPGLYQVLDRVLSFFWVLNHWLLTTTHPVGDSYPSALPLRLRDLQIASMWLSGDWGGTRAGRLLSPTFLLICEGLSWGRWVRGLQSRVRAGDFSCVVFAC